MLSVLAFLLLNILFGFLLCFYGKKIVGWALSIFLIVLVGTFVYNKYGFSQRNLIIFAIFALVVLLVFNFFVKFGLFIIGGLVGLFAGMLLISYLPKSYNKYSKIILIMVVLIFAIITALSKNKILAFLTALAGANVLSSSLVFLAYNIQNVKVLSKKLPIGRMDKLIKSFVSQTSAKSQIVLIGIVILTIVGYIFQNRKRVKS